MKYAIGTSTVIVGMWRQNKAMCGIVGFINVTANEHKIHKVRRSFTELMVATSVRGTDATGMFVTGTPSWTYKKAKLAREAVHTHGYKHMLYKRFNTDTPLIVGHCRQATHGDLDNSNNHPVQAGNILLVHNGVIFNHAELNKDWPEAPQVDTSAIAHVLDKAMIIDRTPQVIEAALNQLVGWWAIAFVHLLEPYKLYLIRHNAPMSMVFDKRTGGWWFASDSGHLHGVLRGQKPWEMTADTLYTFSNDHILGTYTKLNIKAESSYHWPNQWAWADDYYDTHPYSSPTTNSYVTPTQYQKLLMEARQRAQDSSWKPEVM